jgi:penicillin-binding protein 1C
VIPTWVRGAFVAAEDHTFATHHGLSLRAIVRALAADVRARRVVAGGSTLTQQLARNLVPRSRTWVGKLQEALWALRLEAHLSKEEILTQYLNRVSFGSSTFGIESAAQVYFGRSARHLSLAQAAALAALPRGPSAYHPLRHPDRLRARQEWVLMRMAAVGLISSLQAAGASREPLDLTAFDAAFRAPHFVQYVLSHLPAWGLGEATEVRTSLEPAIQRRLEEAVEEELAFLRSRHVTQAAAIVVDNESAQVLAYVGSADFFDDGLAGQYDGVQVPRQPGSALKPFLYAQAFAAGLTPASLLADTPVAFDAPRGPYHPQNYDRRSHGPVRAREALGSSLNVPAVRVAERLGPQRILRGLRQAGFDSLSAPASHYGLGLALGDGEVTLWELVRAYSGLARGGKLHPLEPVLGARGPGGQPVQGRPEHRAGRFVDAAVAGLVTDILSDPSARARAFGLDNVLRFPFPAAAKTGTSKGFADNWTVGYTRERTVAVWMGNFDRSSMQDVSGVMGAAPLFGRALRLAMEGVAPRPLVEARLSQVSICPLSGARAGPACPASIEERFVPGTEPQAECAMHRPYALTPLPRAQKERCERRARGLPFLTEVGPKFHAWAAHEGWEVGAAGCASEVTEPQTSVEVLSPAQNEHFVLLGDLSSADQAVPVRLGADASAGRLEVRVNGELATELSPPYEGHLHARPGVHLLTVHRPGESRPLAQVRYEVSLPRTPRP